jgi:hypothetical protein
VEHLDGKPPEAPKPGPKFKPLSPRGPATDLVVKDVTPGSLLHVATDLLHFDEARTRKDGSARTRGTTELLEHLSTNYGVSRELAARQVENSGAIISQSVKEELLSYTLDKRFNY